MLATLYLYSYRNVCFPFYFFFNYFFLVVCVFNFYFNRGFSVFYTDLNILFCRGCRKNFVIYFYTCPAAISIIIFIFAFIIIFIYIFIIILVFQFFFIGFNILISFILSKDEI